MSVVHLLQNSVLRFIPCSRVRDRARITEKLLIVAVGIYVGIVDADTAYLGRVVIDCVVGL